MLSPVGLKSRRPRVGPGCVRAGALGWFRGGSPPGAPTSLIPKALKRPHAAAGTSKQFTTIIKITGTTRRSGARTCATVNDIPSDITVAMIETAIAALNKVVSSGYQCASSVAYPVGRGSARAGAPGRSRGRSAPPCPRAAPSAPLRIPARTGHPDLGRARADTCGAESDRRLLLRTVPLRQMTCHQLPVVPLRETAGRTPPQRVIRHVC